MKKKKYLYSFLEGDIIRKAMIEADLAPFFIKVMKEEKDQELQV